MLAARANRTGKTVHLTTYTMCMQKIVVQALQNLGKERSSSVTECLTRERGLADSRFIGGAALCPWARHSILYLVLVQPRKTLPDMTEKL